MFWDIRSSIISSAFFTNLIPSKISYLKLQRRIEFHKLILFGSKKKKLKLRYSVDSCSVIKLYKLIQHNFFFLGCDGYDLMVVRKCTIMSLDDSSLPHIVRTFFFLLFQRDWKESYNLWSYLIWPPLQFSIGSWS